MSLNSLNLSKLKTSLAFFALLFAYQAQAAERVVVLTPDVADMVIAVGGASMVVGRDSLTVDPLLSKAKVVGFTKSLTPEAIISVKPTLILGSSMVQPAGIFKRLEDAGFKTKKLNMKEDAASYAASMEEVGVVLGRPEAGKAAAQKWLAGMQPKIVSGKRYLLTYDGKMVAGKNTAGDAMIRAAGGINATGNVEGFKTLNKEAWQAAKPDVVLIAPHNRASYGDVNAFLKRPEVASTPAGKNRQVYEWAARDYLRLGIDSPKNAAKLAKLGSK